MTAPEPEPELGRVAQFHAFEKRHDLFAATVSGISCWRVMRNFLFYRHQGLPATVGSVAQYKRLLIAIYAIAKLLGALVFPRKSELLFKGCVSALRWQIDNRWFDPAIDTVLVQGSTVFKIIEQNSSAFALQSANAAYPSDLEVSAFTLLGRLLGTAFPSDTGAFHTKVAELLNTELGVQITPADLRFRISTVIWQARLYRLLLKRVRPAHVVVTDTGEYGLRLACLQMQIPFFEIQHGIFDAAHPDAIPEDAAGSDGELLIPDRLLSKGQFWIDQLEGYRHSRVAVPVGSAIIDFWRSSEKRSSTADFHVVVTTQGIAIDQLIDTLRAAIAVAPEDLDWHISIKLHPVYDDVEDYVSAFKDCSRVTIMEGSSHPNVYELLAGCDLHVSISSACHFDALALGKQTLMLPLQSHENLLYAVRPSGLSLLSAPGDIWASVQRGDSTAECDYYSNSGYVANVMDCFKSWPSRCGSVFDGGISDDVAIK